MRANDFSTKLRCRTAITAASACIAVAIILGAPTLSTAGDSSAVTAGIKRLEELIAVQHRQIEQQRALIEEQQKRLQALETAVLEEFRPAAGPNPAAGDTVSVQPAAAEPAKPKTVETTKVAQRDTPDRAVGEPDPQKDVLQDQLAAVPRVRGVLTPKGALVVEPSLRYEQSSSRVFFFNGLEVIDTVLIGDIEVTNADRNMMVATGAVRYGLTDRAEIDLSLPFVYRDDSVTSEIISQGGTETNRSLSTSHIGDVEVTGRYQLSDGGGGWPIFLGSLRLRSPTGKGPYDVSRDADGIEEELTTGAGFWGLQPGITAVLPTDPAVLYANASYMWNIKDNVGEDVGASRIGEVDPGDVVTLGVGLGLALNEKVSLSMGYEHNFVGKTNQEINNRNVKSDSFDVGFLNFGVTYRVSDSFSYNFAVQIGVTDDAPDVSVAIRTPFVYGRD